MDGEPSVKVDLDRIVNLADQMKRMNLKIEDRVPGLVRELKVMTENLRRDYSESRSVQTTIDETERLLEEVFNLSKSISNQLDQKEKSLRKVSAQYAEIEKKTTLMLKRTVKFTIIGWETGLLKSGKSNVIRSRPLMGNAGTETLNWKDTFKRFVQQPLMLVTGAPLLQRLEHVKEDERISHLLRQMESGDWTEKERAWLELIQIAEAFENIARSQRAYAIYKTYGNGPYMESARLYAREQREKLKQLGVSEKWFGANVNLSGHYSGSPLTACQYNPLKHDASPMPEEPELRLMIAAGLLNNTYRTWVQLTYGSTESAIKRMEAERKDADRILEKAVEYYNQKRQESSTADFQLYYVSLTLALRIEHGADQIGNLDYWLGQQLSNERKMEIAQALRDAGTEEVAVNSLYILTPTYEQAQSDLAGGYGAGAPSVVPRRSPGMPKVKTPDIASETLPSNKLKVKLPALPATDLRKFFQDMRKDLWNWGSRTNLATTGPSIDGISNNNSKLQTPSPSVNQLQYRQVFMDGDGNSSGGSPKKPGDLTEKGEGAGNNSWKLENFKNTDDFKKGTTSNAVDHIFEGEIIKGQAVGFHYEGMPSSKGKVIGNIDPPNEYGVYRANIEVDGIPKSAKSTFFPKDWTPQQVIDEINIAFNNKMVHKNNRYRGTASTGMKIEFVIKNGKITSAYPLY